MTTFVENCLRNVNFVLLYVEFDFKTVYTIENEIVLLSFYSLLL